jgi:CRISPR-associated protein Csm2
MMSYYLDERGNPKAELLDEEAQKTAEQLVNHRDRRKGINANQLRKFYNDCKAMERKYSFVCHQLRDQEHSDADAKQIALQRVYPRLKMLKSKAAYASNGKIPPQFSTWLEKHIDAIDPNQPADFETFMLCFEAVVGFCYGLGLSNN